MPSPRLPPEITTTRLLFIASHDLSTVILRKRGDEINQSRALVWRQCAAAVVHDRSFQFSFGTTLFRDHFGPHQLTGERTAPAGHPDIQHSGHFHYFFLDLRRKNFAAANINDVGFATKKINAVAANLD
jgi:hypothetical protein